MSFFPGKAKDQDPFTKKSQFYVEFLGWMECRGLRGQRYTDPVIRELRRRQKKMDRPPKLTIQVSRKELKITQDVEEKKKNIKKIKFPTIPARDVTYVHQATRPEDGRLDDIVACIYLGYMPRTQRYVHVHVYRFDEPNTASIFASQMAALVEANMENIRKVEIDLANGGQVDDPRLTSSDGMSEQHTTDSASSAYSEDGSPTFGSDEIDADLQSLKDVEAFDNVADELKFRLQMKDTPILLPPKDYDTISRAHGNVDQANKRRCLNLNIVGEMAKDRNGSTESGVDLTSPGSEGGDTGEKDPADITPSPKLKKAASFDSPRNSLQVPQKLKPSPDVNNLRLASPNSKNQRDVKLSPQVPHRPDLPDLNGYPHSRSDKSPGTPPPLKDIVYPPKVTSPPMSPRLYRPVHCRQNSQNSQHGSDYEQREPVPLVHYKSEAFEDIYTMPMGGSRIPHNRMAPTVDEVPPDYNDDVEDGVQLRMGHQFHQPHLTRSLPAELIRSEMNVGSNSRPNSGEFRHLRRTESPVFVGGHHALGANTGRYSPHIQSYGVSKR